jgi:hypothetical protein
MVVRIEIPLEEQVTVAIFEIIEENGKWDLADMSIISTAYALNY